MSGLLDRTELQYGRLLAPMALVDGERITGPFLLCAGHMLFAAALLFMRGGAQLRVVRRDDVARAARAIQAAHRERQHCCGCLGEPTALEIFPLLTAADLAQREPGARA